MTDLKAKAQSINMLNQTKNEKKKHIEKFITNDEPAVIIFLFFVWLLKLKLKGEKNMRKKLTKINAKTPDNTLLKSEKIKIHYHISQFVE